MSNYVEIDKIKLESIKVSEAEQKNIPGSKKTYKMHKILYAYKPTNVKILSVMLPEVSCNGIHKNKEQDSVFSVIKLNMKEQEHVTTYLKLREIYSEIANKYCLMAKKDFDPKKPFSSSNLTFCIFEDGERDTADVNECDENGCKTIFCKVLYYNKKINTTFVGLNNKPIDPEKLYSTSIKMIPIIQFTKIFITKTVQKIFISLSSALITEYKPRNAIDFGSKISKFLEKRPDALEIFEKSLEISSTKNDQSKENSDEEDDEEEVKNSPKRKSTKSIEDL